MLLPYISAWTVREYLDESPGAARRLIGPSLPLTLLVIRHQVPRGCPSPESELTRSVFGHNPLL